MGIKEIKINTLLSYLTIIFMALFQSVNYHFFIIENDFAPAGLNGIITMIQYKTGFSISYMSLIINIPLCIIAYFILEKRYALRTIIFTLVNSFSYLYLQKIGLDNFKYDANGHDTIFPAIISGVSAGIISGYCFKHFSASGGMEMISKFINKVKPDANFFKISFILNTIVALISLFVYSKNRVIDYKPVALCITYCFLSTIVGNAIIKGSKTAYKFTIITTHPTEITEEIFHILRHGATVLNARGAYTHTDKSVLICVVNKHQINDFKNIIEKYDNTFSFYELVNETYGRFKTIKP